MRLRLANLAGNGCNAGMRLQLMLLLLATLLTACTHAPPRNPMAQWVPSPNHEPRRPILKIGRAHV